MRRVGANSAASHRNFRAPIPKWRLLMSIINYASREIQFKIVYYGPALCGKTTNLGYIHQRINPQNRGDLVSLATAADRKSTRLNSSHSQISYAVFCLKKKISP